MAPQSDRRSPMNNSQPPHLPRQVGIDAYGKGGFRFADMSHIGSLLCLPAGMFSWPVTTPAQLDAASLQPVFDAALDIDVFFIGMGEDIAPLDPALKQLFKANNIIVEALSTGSALRTYNIMLSESRAVAAALMAVERRRP